MCGIASIINLNGKPVITEEINLMMQKMKHRGPDDEGVYIKGYVGLGFVRLSIIDLSKAGHQPMFSNDGRYVIIYNGEVYNYLEIRNELKHKYKFKSNTDTEVVLAAYQVWGEECLGKLNGMFAFIIYDTIKKQFFGARDRFGIKPLYYYLDTNRIIFASEIKSILPLIKPEVNNKSVYNYLVYNRTDITEETFFSNIKKVPHGSWFEISDNRVKIKKWYNLSDNCSQERQISPEEYRELFKDSLRLRLRADVPVGVSLSGGIDSSVIAASLVKDFKLKNINSFSAVYGSHEPSDESSFINEFRPIINNMHFTHPDADTFFTDYKKFIEAHNEPVADIGPYAQYKVMELASSHVKVTLDGQGADEQLAGYHYFFGSYFKELLLGYNYCKLFSENFHYLLTHRSFTAIKYFVYYLLGPNYQKRLNRVVFPSINRQFLEDYDSSEVNSLLLSPNSLNQSLLQHFEYKLEHLLRWEDLNAMNFSIESRVPFLDYRLVEATISSPPFQKINRGNTKSVLREAFHDILPEKIFNRKDKKGFSNPRDKWFREKPFFTMIMDLINSNSFQNNIYFDVNAAELQYKRHMNEEIDASREIWKWVNLSTWYNNSFGNS